MARATPVGIELTSSRWGAYEVLRRDGRAAGLAAFRDREPFVEVSWDSNACAAT